jgi:hypothetical protein
MKSKVGLMGVILFTVGGAILFSGLGDLFYNGDYTSPVGFVMIGLLGFFFIGLGLWVIVLSGKPETKQNPS